MDTTLPPLQNADESSDDVSREQHQFKTSDEYLRNLLSNITCALIFFISALLVLLLLPFYPAAMAVLLAILFGLIAIKSPGISLGSLLAFAAPAYAYQLGGMAWAIGIMGGLSIILPIGLRKLPGIAIGCVAGLAAGALMLTPVFYLSLPLLAVISLLRLKGSSFSVMWGVFMFLVVYLPFLFINPTTSISGHNVPLFIEVNFAQRPALDIFNLNAIKNAFSVPINGNSADFPSISAYFFEGWSGIALILSLILAFLTPVIPLSLSKRMDKSKYVLQNLMPFLSLLLIELVFLTPILLLRKPLGYHTGFDNSTNIIVLTFTMILIGGIGYATKDWLRKRDLKVDIEGKLTSLLIEIKNQLENSKRRLQQTISICRNIGLENEKANIAQWEEKVTLALESIHVLNLHKLEDSLTEFTNIRTQAIDLEKKIENKFYEYSDNSKTIYTDIVNGALKLGLPISENAIQSMTITIDRHNYETALSNQQMLNTAFKELASSLVSTGDMLADIVQKEIDPEFSLTTIEIGRGFLEHGRYETAAQTILEDLQIIDSRVENPIRELATQITVMAEEFRNVTSTHLIPVFDLLGNISLAKKCHQTVEQLDSIMKSVNKSGTLTDLIGIVDQGRILTQLASNTVGELRLKIVNLEKDNDRRCPPKYQWGRNSFLAIDTQQLQSSIESTSSKLTISNRFNLIEKAVKLIEQQAKIIKMYSLSNELLINFPLIETIIDNYLGENGTVDSSNIPVVTKYALEYLKMYNAKHTDCVVFEPISGCIKNIAQTDENI